MLNIEEKIEKIEELRQQEEETQGAYMYINNVWANKCELSEEEVKTGFASEYRVMNYCFDNMILANTLCENLIAESWENYSMNELLGFEEDEEGNYPEEYQFFIVDLALDEERTINLLKNANCSFTLRYDNNNDIYILGLCDLGMSRRYIMSDIKLTTNYEQHNCYENLEEESEEEKD